MGSAFQRDPALQFGLPEGTGIDETLIGDLVNTADELRDLAVQLGTRPWRVFRVWVMWEGAEIGEGDPTVVESEILPTPKVTEKGPEDGKRSRNYSSGGITEDGAFELAGVSLTYSEDQLLGKVITGIPPEDEEEENADDMTGKNIEFFYELRGFETNGRRIRLIPSGVPERRYGGVEWVVVCIQQKKRRTRGGELT